MDAYKKLRPWTEIESCDCPQVEGLLLVDLLTDNPLHCSACRKEVDPARIALSEDETESLARWFSAASALYRLWLHSGEYESYAKEQLINPNPGSHLSDRRNCTSMAACQMHMTWACDDGRCWRTNAGRARMPQSRRSSI